MKFPDNINFIDNTAGYKSQFKIDGQIMHLIQCFYQLYKLVVNNNINLFTIQNLNMAFTNIKSSVIWLEQKLTDAGYNSESAMPQGETKAMVLDLKSQDSDEYWMGYNNFAVIMKYNSSVLYAMVITQLSRKIQVAYEQQANQDTTNNSAAFNA